jgi:predicted transcriptional regulator
MPYRQHQCVRTTLTLDEDVAAKLKSLARRTSRAFRDVVNETLRRGLAGSLQPRARQPFRIEARDLGRCRPGLNMDDIGELLDQVEGPLHR